VRHIAADDLLRAEARAGTPADREIAACQRRGDLIPDQITADVTRHQLAVFAETSRPLIRYCKNRGILVTVNFFPGAGRRRQALAVRSRASQAAASRRLSWIWGATSRLCSTCPSFSRMNELVVYRVTPR
jgi:adenylate kinase family enzyme